MSKTKPTESPTLPADIDLPKGWATATLPQVIGSAGLFSDGDWIESKDQDTDGNVRLIQLADIGDGEYRNRSSRFLMQEKADELSCTFLLPGDILVARMPDPLGRACVFPGDAKPSVTAVDVCIVRPSGDAADPRWLMYTINSPDFRGAISEYERGTTRKRISRTNLGLIHFPLPPVAEQKRIVAKVEALLTRVNAARARLAKVPAILKRFRQSVLAAACSGQLTADWRADHPTTASTERRRELLAKDREDQIKTNWRPGGRRTRARSPLHLSYNPVEETPAEWLWCTFDEGTTLITKGSSPGWQGFDYQTAGVLFVRSQNVRWGTVDLTDKTFLPQRFNDEHAGSIIHTNDVLLNLVGASIGRSAVAPDETDGANCNQAVGIIRPVSGHLLPRWAMWYLLSCGAQEHIASTKADVARANFNLDDIRPMPLVLPPITEQSEIVRCVEALFTLADRIEARVQAATARVEKITQAILAKAFRGELVPTEAELARAERRDYEPATVLLARIRATRAAEVSKTKRATHRQSRGQRNG